MPEANPLPQGFADLARFVSAWALPTETERSCKRRSSSMEELRTYYESLLPRMDAIIAHLNQFPLDALPEPEQRLLYLALSFMEVSPAVELFNAPDEPGVFDAARFRIVEP